MPDDDQDEASGTPPPKERLASDCFIKPSFTLEQLRTFLAVASREHITHAATALRLTQAAVTQQVRLLERALGVRLLQRVGRNIRLTDAGVEIAGACLVIMRALENLERVARSVRTLETGSLNIGASEVAASYYLSSTLVSFTSAHPTVDMNVVVGTTADVCDRVLSGSLECGLVDGPLPRTSLDHRRVATDEVVLVAHRDHPLAGVGRLGPRDFAGVQYLAWEPGAATGVLAAEMLGSAYPLLRRVQLTGLEAVRQSLLAGLGFGALPRAAVAEHLEQGRLAQVGALCRQRAIMAVRRPTQCSSTAEAFWTILVDNGHRGCPGSSRTAS